MRKTLFALMAIFAISNLASAATNLESLIVSRNIEADGREIVGIKTLPIPVRPPGFEANAVKRFPKTAVTLEAPAFDWTYGCSATSAGMMFGYYDRNGYANFYSGSVGGGVCPLTNADWPKSTYPGTTCGNCPIVATKLGIDARTTRGHVDDYWRDLDSTADPYYAGGWAQHAPLDCAADFMGTNQYQSWRNADGATTFYNYTNGDPLYDCPDQEGGRDGCHGMKLFANYCGYTVPDKGNYSQYIYGYKGNTKGFTFAQYMAEIDAAHPVIIQVSGHTMLGVGYDASSQTVYLHDTWDYTAHQMTWGGSYSGMAHYGVTVFRLSNSALTPTVSANPSGYVPGQNITINFTFNYTGGGNREFFCQGRFYRNPS